MDYGYGNYNTSYGAQGATDGGGFVGGEPTSSPAGGRQGGYGKDTVRPVTIKQILDAHQPHPDADFRIDGDGVSQITFVGQIRSIKSQATNITYELDDGTGIIEVKQWVDADKDTDAMEVDSHKKIVENGYCRVWGRPKSFNNKRHIGAHVIRPITDYNEINYHLLEATAIHLFFTRGPPPSGDGMNGHKADGGMNGQQQDLSGVPRFLSGMSPLARRIYTTMKGAQGGNEGLHVQMIASMMGIDVNEVYKGAEELVVAGVIFTTVDDNTWAVLET